MATDPSSADPQATPSQSITARECLRIRQTSFRAALRLPLGCLPRHWSGLSLPRCEGNEKVTGLSEQRAASKPAVEGAEAYIGVHQLGHTLNASRHLEHRHFFSAG